ncbi:ATP-binding cassette domain-containing protein, partial [Pseudomonas sp. 2995-1]|uniref:ATP-binding cassette domain-containing protein n=1 Tax=Pseudomonas sp. 2995-1 TaxID=1712679 RepID=UPI001179B441
MTSSLEIREGTTNFKNFQLGPINLKIEKGMITALIGRNGAGKTTLLKSTSGIPPFQQGEVTY